MIRSGLVFVEKAIVANVSLIESRLIQQGGQSVLFASSKNRNATSIPILWEFPDWGAMPGEWGKP